MNREGLWCEGKAPPLTWVWSQGCLLHKFSIKNTSRSCSFFSILPLFHSRNRLFFKKLSTRQTWIKIHKYITNGTIGLSTFYLKKKLPLSWVNLTYRFLIPYIVTDRKHSSLSLNWALKNYYCGLWIFLWELYSDRIQICYIFFKKDKSQMTE